MICIAAASIEDAATPIRSHVYSALKSGDISLAEMQEVVLHFAVYGSWPKASALNQVVEESWSRIESEQA
jgi:4-carboxymuconolactone decarboxylase